MVVSRFSGRADPGSRRRFHLSGFFGTRNRLASTVRCPGRPRARRPAGWRMFFRSREQAHIVLGRGAEGSGRCSGIWGTFGAWWCLGRRASARDAAWSSFEPERPKSLDSPCSLAGCSVEELSDLLIEVKAMAAEIKALSFFCP